MSISRVYKIVNDIDDLVYIGSTKQILCRRMTEHRKLALTGCARKLYIHMREIGAEHFKILGVREYKDISKERLKYKEDKYIKRFDTVKKGLNTYYAFGEKCEHNVRRYCCVECKGTQICEHQRRKTQCRDCGGSSMCEHNKRKSQCSDCGGSSMCEHDKRKSQCKVCSPAVCIKCLKVYAGKSKLQIHQRKCLMDQPSISSE
jgi:hypothetical protein